MITDYRAARARRLTAAEKEANRLVARERAANELGFADLKNWQILTKLRMNARHATALLRVFLVLTRAEISRWQTITNTDHDSNQPEHHNEASR